MESYSRAETVEQYGPDRDRHSISDGMQHREAEINQQISEGDTGERLTTAYGGWGPSHGGSEAWQRYNMMRIHNPRRQQIQ